MALDTCVAVYVVRIVKIFISVYKLPPGQPSSHNSISTNEALRNYVTFISTNGIC